MKEAVNASGVAMAARALPVAKHDDAAFLADFAAHGVAFRQGFLDAGRKEKLLSQVIEQADLEREQGVAELSGTGTASESGLAPAGAEVAPFQAISFLPNKGRDFVELACDPRILDIVGTAFGGVPFHLTSATATIVRNGAEGQVIHADQQAWPFPTPVPVMLTLVVCLSDFTPEMGATRFVPDTRDLPPPAIGMLPETGRVGNLDVLEPLSFAAPAGSLAMWEGRIWHGQGPSHSDSPRVGIILTYAMHMVRAQEDYAASLHDDVYAGLSDDERAVLGLKVHFSYAGRVAPRHPGDRRSCTNYACPYVPELRRGSARVAVPISR